MCPGVGVAPRLIPPRSVEGARRDCAWGLGVLSGWAATESGRLLVRLRDSQACHSQLTVIEPVTSCPNVCHSVHILFVSQNHHAPVSDGAKYVLSEKRLFHVVNVSGLPAVDTRPVIPTSIRMVLW